jgi:hypothetical protein
MDFVDVLRAAQPEVLGDASEALQRAHLAHYEAAGSEESRRRLSDLFALSIDCLAARALGPICDYAESVARQRYDAGFDIAEVQAAFNVLEEAIWRAVITKLPADDIVEAAGLVGTVLGAGKDTLARTWVSLAASRHAPSLDLSALFKGTRN